MVQVRDPDNFGTGIADGTRRIENAREQTVLGTLCASGNRLEDGARRIKDARERGAGRF